MDPAERTPDAETEQPASAEAAAEQDAAPGPQPEADPQPTDAPGTVTETVAQEEPVEVPEPSSGERLRAAREGRGLSLKDVAATTRQSVDVLAAIERMETDHISATILRMQVRGYADFLGLPGNEIAASYSRTRATPDTANMPSERIRRSDGHKRRQVWPYAAGLGVLLAGATALVWMLQPSTPTASPATTSIASRVTHPAQAQIDRRKLAGTTAEREISIRATRSAFIEVRGSDGTIFRSRNMARGETYYPRMNAAWTVTVRDAGAFEWWLDDYRIGPLGEEGTPVYALNVDDATARGREQLSTALAEASQGPGQPR